METAVNVLVGLALIVLVGAGALGWVAVRNMRREKAEREADKANALKAGGGGGPDPVR